MVIAYKNESENLRQLTVYSGLSSVLVESVKEDVVVSGFKTPSTGPVTFELGIYTYEGDRGYFGDQLLAKSGKNPSFVNISDKINKSDNIYNSTISRFGELTKFRIPNYNNNFSIYSDPYSQKNVTIPVGYDECNIIFIKGINPYYNMEGTQWGDSVSFWSNSLTQSGNTLTLSDYYSL
jgi:hypothetical protein